MAEPAGLALGVIGVAGLFSACIECFDIVVAGREFSEDYEQLLTLFSTQRMRFGLWGQSVGLFPDPNDGSFLPYNKNIDRPDIRSGVDRILENIRSVLDEAGKVDERYGLKADEAPGLEVSTSKGINIFKPSFDKWKARIRKHQKETTVWHVTRWAVHDAKKFEGMIDRLKDFVDGLESITKSLGLLEEQRRLLKEEIHSISDVESLRLLRDASSSHRSSQKDISDTASRRMITVAESILEERSLVSASILMSTGESFVTAPSVARDGNNPQIPGAWPQSLKSGLHTRATRQSRISCVECTEEHYKCDSSADKNDACARCIQKARSCSFANRIVEINSIPETRAMVAQANLESEVSTSYEDIPQNQRLLSKLIETAGPREPLSFAKGDSCYGEALATIKAEDEAYWLQHSERFISHAQSGSSAAKRMFLELRNIRAARVPFVTAVPLDDTLDKILASIEGPPETPYAGGVFWLTIKLSDIDPFGPPLIRFQTKIYHPNISPQGHICADYDKKWAPGTSRSARDPSGLWYHGKSSDIRWSLGAILTALCGLLSSPNVEDPLVPEIAQKYLEDYSEYCENAREYTRRFASKERPAKDSLSFLEDVKPDRREVVQVEKPRNLDIEADKVSLQNSLRELYDDKAYPSWANITQQSLTDSSTRSDNIQSANSSTFTEWTTATKVLGVLDLTTIPQTLNKMGQLTMAIEDKRKALPGNSVVDLVAAVTTILYYKGYEVTNFEVLCHLLIIGLRTAPLLGPIHSHILDLSIDILASSAQTANVLVWPCDMMTFTIELIVSCPPNSGRRSWTRLRRSWHEFMTLKKWLDHASLDGPEGVPIGSAYAFDARLEAQDPWMSSFQLGTWLGQVLYTATPFLWKIPDFLLFVEPKDNGWVSTGEQSKSQIAPYLPRRLLQGLWITPISHESENPRLDKTKQRLWFESSGKEFTITRYQKCDNNNYFNIFRTSQVKSVTEGEKGADIVPVNLSLEQRKRLFFINFKGSLGTECMLAESQAARDLFISTIRRLVDPPRPEEGPPT